MDIEDAALMYEGWGDEMLYEQQIARKMTVIIADVTNRSFGGKGVSKHINKIWPLPGDSDKKPASSKMLQRLQQFKELELSKGISEIKIEEPEITIKEFPKRKKNGKR